MNSTMETISNKTTLFQSTEENQKTIERLVGTTANGEPFNDYIIHLVWEKAQEDYGFYCYRRDCYGTTIAKYDYGKKTKYGWIIDHIIPVTKNGTDDLENLQPLHWENNLAKGDNYPEWDKNNQ